MSELRWSPCDGSLVGEPVYYASVGCLIGEDQDGVDRLFVPMFEAPGREEVNAAIQAGRRCVRPGAPYLIDERHPRVAFVDLASFVSCEDPVCQGGGLDRDVAK